MVYIIKSTCKSEYHPKRLERFLLRFTHGLTDINIQQIVSDVGIAMPDYDISFGDFLDIIVRTLVSYSIFNNDYDKMCGRLLLDDLRKTTNNDFGVVTEQMKPHLDPTYYSSASKLAPQLQKVIVEQSKHKTILDDIGFLAISCIRRNYLFHDPKNRQLVEQPEHMWMRVAVRIHGENIADVVDTYKSLISGEYTHATPTLTNAGIARGQLSSCFLLTLAGDFVDSIECDLPKIHSIMMRLGGIGASITKMEPAQSTNLNRVNYVAPGIAAYAKNIFDSSVDLISRTSNRSSSMALYIEPWHVEIYKFLHLRRNRQNSGDMTQCNFIHTALWVPDLLLERLEANEDTWSLFNPSDVKREYGVELDEFFGDEFKQLYEHIERERKIDITTTSVKKLITEILCSMIETGEPYIHFKDSVNRKNNQSNVGVIHNSNLCSEIMEVSSTTSTAVCNLASISLPACVRNGAFDFDVLKQIVGKLVRNLNRLIDVNCLPCDDARKTDNSMRAIGIGVQGLADVFYMLMLSWDDPAAEQLSTDIAECMYYHAVLASANEARLYGTYPLYAGSPMSKGILHPDMWQRDLSDSALDWDALRSTVAEHGVRNSLLIAYMPTATTSQVLGNIEAFEPLTNNIYLRNLWLGEVYVVNKYLFNWLRDNNLLTRDIIHKIIVANGSVQQIDGIPPRQKEIFRTVWEIPMKTMARMNLARAPFIDQSQSSNGYFSAPTMQNILSLIMYMWRGGAKTATYYLRTKSPIDSIKFSLDPEVIDECRKESAKTCDSCSA